MSLVSKIKDQNIFHIFAFDIIKYYDSKYKNVIIDSNNLDLENPCQKWRCFVMEKIYNDVKYSKNITQENNITHNGYNYWKFINYKPDTHIRKLYNIISSRNDGKYILINQRNLEDRYLYDYSTKAKLEDYLATQDLKLPLKVCNFGNMPPEKQYEMCADCALLISAHGAGCTNLIFTPKNAPLIEVNLRKNWYCDSVCDNHYYGRISINEKCDGELKHYPYFHKADYHNLCRLIGKKYLEIEAIEYSEGFNSRNPISKKRIFIDGGDIVKKVNMLI